MKYNWSQIERKLISLDFYFIRELKNEVYEKIYAKDIAETKKIKGEIVYNSVCFWSKKNCDHRFCIRFNDILLPNLKEKGKNNETD